MPVRKSDGYRLLPKARRFPRLVGGTLPFFFAKSSLVIWLLVAGLLVALVFHINKKPATSYQTTSIGNREFKLEIADTLFERSSGLMYRKSLEPDEGMLFIFEEEGIYPFWMKNTYIPMDIIWLNADGGVVFIKENAQPCVTKVCTSIVPDAKAKYVIEINGGLVDELGLEVGSRLSM